MRDAGRSGAPGQAAPQAVGVAGGGAERRTSARQIRDRPGGWRPPVWRARRQLRGAERLLDNGYEPLPIVPLAKHPKLTGWTRLTIDMAQVVRWGRQFPRHGVGLRTGRLVGIDIDLLDPDLAHQAGSIVEPRLGATLMRVGRWQKRLLLYRTEAAFRKIKIAGVEVLATGQQFAAFGIHPGVLRPYDWPLGESPLDVALDALPLVTCKQCAELIVELSQLLPTPQHGARRRRSGPGGATTAGPVRGADGLVADGRDAWLSTIAFHAVHDALDAGRPPDRGALAQQVWARFQATSDLRRERQDGDARYELSDAARKVADKLRLAAEGRRPPRLEAGAETVEPPPASPAEDARARLEALIAAACARVRAWHAAGMRGPPPQIGLKATVGLGKSVASRRLLRALREELQAAGLPSRLIVLTPSHALAEEAAAACRGEAITPPSGAATRHDIRSSVVRCAPIRRQCAPRSRRASTCIRPPVRRGADKGAVTSKAARSKRTGPRLRARTSSSRRTTRSSPASRSSRARWR